MELCRWLLDLCVLSCHALQISIEEFVLFVFPNSMEAQVRCTGACENHVVMSLLPVCLSVCLSA